LLGSSLDIEPESSMIASTFVACLQAELVAVGDAPAPPAGTITSAATAASTASGPPRFRNFSPAPWQLSGGSLSAAAGEVITTID
jgi:hypothetical protein